MIQNKLNKAKQIHLIGIGGIGMSALAKLLHETNKTITGSDMHSNNQTANLLEKGIKVTISHKTGNIKENHDLIIYSLAIPNSNPELLRAKELGINCLSYPEALGLFTDNYKLIAIAGTHGKTTTTGMLSKILLDANIDPTILIGSTTPHLNNENYRKGSSEWMLIEACEYHAGFLHFSPYITLITNLEHDHFDAYPEEKDYLEAFQKLINNTKFKTIINRDLELSKKLKGHQNNQDFQQGNLKFTLKALGKHNNTNAIGAYHVAKTLGINDKAIKNSLSEFQGTARRMEVKKETDTQIFIDDYGHHPSEIKAVLNALKNEFPNKKIALIFQAHQHNRTILLLKDFVNSFQKADKVIIPNIYQARDKAEDINSMSAEKFTEEISKRHSNVVYGHGLEQTKANLSKLTKGYEIVLVMGAGNVTQILND